MILIDRVTAELDGTMVITRFEVWRNQWHTTSNALLIYRGVLALLLCSSQPQVYVEMRLL